MNTHFLSFRTLSLGILLFLVASTTSHCFAQESVPVPAPEVDPQTGGLTPDQGKDIVTIYDQAVVHLEKVCDDYRRIRALQLMRQRDLAFADAYANISSVMPALDPINRPLLRKALRDPSDIVPHKQAVEKVESEIEAMIALVAKLLAEIEKVEAEMREQTAGEQTTLEEIIAREEFDPEEIAEALDAANTREAQVDMQEMAEAAKEDEAQIAKDLTPLMADIPPPPVNQADLTSQPDQPATSPQHFVSGTDALDVLNKISKPDLRNLILGRKVSEPGTPSEWMFIDTWHTIGPFPNPGRLNINRKFPPETIIDFDASYQGKGNEMVRWEFVQSGQPMVKPANDQEYAIYYAYTEIYFDRSMDLWVAIGSDDRGEVWLNDAPIWISSEKLKGWKIAEGFRKVRFQAGVNRVLFRIENGWRETAFSFGVRVAN